MKPPAYSPSDFNLQLCHVLGLDPNKVRQITIRAEAHQMAVVEVMQLMPVAESGALFAEMRRYRLMPIEDEE